MLFYSSDNFLNHLVLLVITLKENVVGLSPYGICNLKMKWSKSRNEGWWTRIKKTEMQASMACRVTKGASKKQSPATDRGIQKHLRNKKGSRRLKNSVRYVWTELNGREREMLRQGCFCFECPQITRYSFYSYCSVDIPGC